MTYSKINIIGRLQRWMDSENGQTFLNYAYSWGASIVILGTLFKLTHLPGANMFLFIGMGTEVLVFFISAFDRPFDIKAGEEGTAAMGLHNDGGFTPDMEELAHRTGMVPNTGETVMLKGLFGSICDTYKQQLEKSVSQMATVEEIDRQLRMMAQNLDDLNKVYARMIEAVRQ